MAIVTIDNLTKRFGRFTALDNVNFSLDRGEVHGFIGPNGAGKTTTIRVLLGIYQASQGNVTIFDKDVWRDAVELHKRIAYVPGDVSLWPNLTGGEVIDLLVRLRKSGGKSRREELIERFDLDPTKKCRTYSKGNRQKVALVAAFASEADLYILDEPTSGLDPLMESVFMDCVAEVKQQGKSVFLSSHILTEVEKLCDKVSIIRKGKIVENGTLDELRHLTRTTINVRTRKPIEGIEANPSVHDLVKNNDLVTFSVDSSAVGKVITQISKYDIISMEGAPPTLEELFMRHYS
ncbi:ABC-2 type transport system ATP-binding protein [Anaerotaenia torta]|uniref:ABC transporter ATP-binding protein n=1 Tax=Anaerotaenia torta TaxID=433293 RepID=UPI003D21C4E0